ncbi:MAG: hypothetical protein K8S24_00995, partial [Candidatus Aegiribacteria sp.]|nr:hypothetical protein [Candidatus Aegiribacteria sp.]
MLSIILSTVILSVVLPNTAEIETIEAGQQAVVNVSSGEGWVRVLEDDFVCLRLSVPDGIQLKAFDVNGNIMCQSESGSDMVLSAFADYWFYVQLVRVDGYSSSSTRIGVEEVPPSELPPGNYVESALGRNVMAETYTFTPSDIGRWTFRLEGSGGTDLDLEVYGPTMSLWGSSMSLEGFETVTVPVLAGEEVTAVVSRYGKTGSGEYEFSVEPSGQFPRFDPYGQTELITLDEIHRYLIPAHESSFFFNVAILSWGADIDIMIRDLSGEYLMGSQSYSSIETLLLPPSANDVVADVILFDTGENEIVSYDIYAREPGPLSNIIPVKEVVNIGSRSNLPVGFSPVHGGLFRISANFEKSRDGDVGIFRGEGEPAVTFSTMRGNEEFLLYVSEGDTVWIDPFFSDSETTGYATVRIARADAIEIDREYTGLISGDSPAEYFTVRAEPETILDIALTGEDREVDLDLFVSGPDLDLIAEGWLSNVDAAGDEAIEVYAGESAEYGITVYLYDRNGQTPFTLEVNRIERTPLAEPSPQPEIWAISA